MRNFIAILVVMVSMFATISAANAETFHGVWSKPVYSVDGLMTMSVEVVKYDLQVPDAPNVGRIMETMPPVIGMVSLQGKFSNLEEFQDRVNERLQEIGAPYKDFRIVDIYVDER